MAQKSWRRITIRTPTEQAETVAGRISELTGLGTEIDDSGRGSITRVIGYLPEDHPELSEKLIAIADFLEELNNRQPHLPDSEIIADSIPEEDWDRKWREGLKPFHIGKVFVVKPSWEDYRPEPGEMVIVMDPGQAFGTGLHASTRLIVELLESLIPDLPKPPGLALDVGTGTGILAICAARLGCGKLTGIDIDPAAVKAARENIAANSLTERIDVTATPLEQMAGPYNQIMANIIHNTLVEMAPSLGNLLAPGGLLLLAGILRGGQAENIRNRYEAQGLIWVDMRQTDEWAALALKKG